MQKPCILYIVAADFVQTCIENEIDAFNTEKNRVSST